MIIKSYIEKITSSKFIICDDNGNEICRVGLSNKASFPKNGNRNLMLAQFVSDAINYYSERCDDSELPIFELAKDSELALIDDE